MQSYLYLSYCSLVDFSRRAASTSRKTDKTPTLLKTEDAPQDQLMSEVNRFARVNSMRAKMDLKFEDNSFAQFGSKEVYRAGRRRDRRSASGKYSAESSGSDHQIRRRPDDVGRREVSASRFCRTAAAGNIRNLLRARTTPIIQNCKRALNQRRTAMARSKSKTSTLLPIFARSILPMRCSFARPTTRMFIRKARSFRSKKIKPSLESRRCEGSDAGYYLLDEFARERAVS